MSRGEILQLISRSSFAVLIYLCLETVWPSSVINKAILALLIAAIINKSSMFQQILKGKISNPIIDHSRGDLIKSITDIKSYTRNAKNWNDRKRLLFKRMPVDHQHMANTIKYPSKLNHLDKIVDRNDKLLQRVSQFAIEKHHITPQELSLLDTKGAGNNYGQVVESLCHFARDWSKQHQEEIDPLIKYMQDQLSSGLNMQDTTIIVPGSGLGRIAYEMYKLKPKEVHSIEYSWLMVLMNEYIISQRAKENVDTIHPYIHTYSNHMSSDDQFRSVTLQKPDSINENFHIHQGDFNKFSLEPNSSNVVIVTCFFIDTAENMIQYFESITNLAKKYPGKKRWINVGPLKYGTAAQVEFNQEEVSQIIQMFGWKMSKKEQRQLLGYLTNKSGLWQGYYDVLKWTAELD